MAGDAHDKYRTLSTEDALRCTADFIAHALKGEHVPNFVLTMRWDRAVLEFEMEPRFECRKGEGWKP